MGTSTKKNMSSGSGSSSYFLPIPEGHWLRRYSPPAPDPGAETPLEKTLADLRFRARKVLERGLPSVRSEAFRYTNLQFLLSEEFTPDRRQVTREEIEEELFRDLPVKEGEHRLVFVNGRFLSELSTGFVSESGLEILRIGGGHGTEARREEEGSKIAEYIGRTTLADFSSIAAWNTAHLHDGVAVFVQRGKKISEPIRIRHFIRGEGNRKIVSFPRLLVVAEEGAEVFVAETYAGDSGRTLTIPMTELIVGRAARVEYCRVVREGGEGVHLSAQEALLEEDAVLRSHAFHFGGALARNDVRAVLNGENVEVTLNGLSLLSGTEHLDNHTVLEHRRPHGRSREIFKSVLADHARNVFRGLIHVWKEAQKTDAVQSNRNILLSPTARVESRPQLEIYADDVKCTHGATVGRLEEEALFYCRSRGIPLESARVLLTQAFAADLVEEVAVKEYREALAEAVRARLERMLGREEPR
ncbi:MAG: Fe-S cluster assembly protein SufD [Candidatus Hydrogenedentota bacterium]|nr:MAG: Fe-S cluster assembly protein SufD [Candidatus Hydrogenedentota bacterium]